MRKGTSVRIVKLTSDRGTTFRSLRNEFDNRIKGTVDSVEDHGNDFRFIMVKFPHIAGPLSVPPELLTPVRG